MTWAEDYHKWLTQQSCYKCGAKYANNTENKVWRTEVDCGCKENPNVKEVNARDVFLASGGIKCW